MHRQTQTHPLSGACRRQLSFPDPNYKSFDPLERATFAARQPLSRAALACDNDIRRRALCHIENWSRDQRPQMNRIAALGTYHAVSPPSHSLRSRHCAQPCALHLGWSSSTTGQSQSACPSSIRWPPAGSVASGRATSLVIVLVTISIWY